MTYASSNCSIIFEESSDDFRCQRLYDRPTPPPPKSSVRRDVFNHRLTATVESRSRKEPPSNWHTLPADWQLPPVPPRSCNPRHARIHGLRRRTGNRLDRSSDASCPFEATTLNLCARSSIQVLAAAYESSCLILRSSPYALTEFFVSTRSLSFRRFPDELEHPVSFEKVAACSPVSYS